MSFIMNNVELKPYSEGELTGLSFAVKDNIDLINEPTGNGSPSWKITHPVAASNAVCIEQVLSAGASCVGKTQLDELAYSLIGINDFYGHSINSKAPDRVTGGSSSGSAAAVASGLVDFSLATDTGGSVRVPASNCGIWGYRPSQGLISVAGVVPLAASFDTVAVLAKNADVLQKVLAVLLAEKISDSLPNLSIIFLDDIFGLCNKALFKTIVPVLTKIAKHFPVQHSTLARVTQLDITASWLFEKVGCLMSVEIWNFFSGWVWKRSAFSEILRFLKQHLSDLIPLMRTGHNSTLKN